MRFDDLNTSNLWSLYRAIGANVDGCRVTRFSGYSMVLSQASAWPNCVFDISDADRSCGSLIDDIHNSISASQANALIISADNREFDTNLRNSPYHYYPIEQWTGMHRNIAPDDALAPDETISSDGSVCTPILANQSEVREWVDVVSEVLFNGKTLAMEIFSWLLQAGHQLIALKRQGMIIGTALIFHDRDDMAGIYMVCVKKEFRGQGLGKAILAYCFDRIGHSGKRTCILQSTRAAIRLYETAGFSKSNLYSLFWKIK